MGHQPGPTVSAQPRCSALGTGALVGSPWQGPALTIISGFLLRGPAVRLEQSLMEQIIIVPYIGPEILFAEHLPHPFICVVHAFHAEKQVFLALLCS